MTWFLDRDYVAAFDFDGFDINAIAALTGLDAERVRVFLDRRRMCWVESAPEDGWLAGANGDGEPTLLFIGYSRLAAVNTHEHPLNTVSVNHQTGALTTHGIALENIYEREWSEILDAAREAIGFQHIGNAPLRPYKHPACWYFSLLPLSWAHQDIIDRRGPSEADITRLREWIEGEGSILLCFRQHTLSATGALLDSM
ncbi:MAG: hypothetical protein H6713_33430 [Myxococcales bacterium]|nr:hypothetical protein [Myxococcales bacterium]